MADVGECIGKLVAAGQISKAIGDEAMDMFRRSKAEYSATLGPAGADAAAALQAAKAMREKSAALQIKIAAQVKTWRTIERRVIDDPRGGMASVTAMSSKDTLRGDNRLAKLRRTEPDHPIFTGQNVGSLHDVMARGFYNMLGPMMEKFRPGFLGNPEAIRSAKHFVYERFGVATGDVAAKVVSDAFGQMIDHGEMLARGAGKVFEPNEDWRLMQPWSPRRVAQFTEPEFVKDWRAEMDAGGVKLWDKEKNAPAALADQDAILKKAYADIKYEGGTTAPFSKEMRTFRFQPGKAGADSWLKLQGKYGVGNEIMAAVDHHIDHMAQEIAMLHVWGPTPDAAFEAAVRLAREKNPGSALPTGLRWFDSENTARLAYQVSSGKGFPVANETAARFMSGMRSLVGAASLRNLPISIIPSDTAMTFMALHHDGMSGFNALSHTFSGMSKDVARHLQIAAHSYMDYVQNSVRRYEDEINVSGLARKVPRAVVKATGADLWTRNIRQGVQLSYLNTLAGARKTPWQNLDAPLRDHFLGQFGFTEADWDKIRALDPYVAGNGAEYTDLPKLTEADRALSERLQTAIADRSSYAAHQPDVRTEAIARGHSVAGTLQGELGLSFFQYKQFALERMSTHLFRILKDGSPGDRVTRGLAFTILSALAGAVSIQADAVVRGENPADANPFSNPKFWMDAWARGGTGGIYGDLLENALRGDASAIGGAALGPIGGLATDAISAAVAPAKNALEDRRTSVNQIFGMGKRWTPNTWYSRLGVDRLLWDKLQVLLDPNYRQSFSRAAKNAQRNGRGGFWWAPGTPAPQTAPQPGTALGR
jgi:hypothetical protein